MLKVNDVMPTACIIDSWQVQPLCCHWRITTGPSDYRKITDYTLIVSFPCAVFVDLSTSVMDHFIYHCVEIFNKS